MILLHHIGHVFFINNANDNNSCDIRDVDDRENNSKDNEHSSDNNTDIEREKKYAQSFHLALGISNSPSH